MAEVIWKLFEGIMFIICIVIMLVIAGSALLILLALLTGAS